MTNISFKHLLNYKQTYFGGAKMEFIDLQRQYRELEKEINEGIKNVLEHGK